MSNHGERDSEAFCVRREFVAGFQAALPLLFGVVSVGLVYGTAALAVGIPPHVAQAMSLLVYTGGAQLVAINLIASRVPPLVVVAAVLVVNLRHLLYSAVLAPHLRLHSAGWKACLAFLLTDELFILTSARLGENAGKMIRWYALGTGLTLWASWQISTALGIAVGARVPPHWELQFVLPLIFLALLVPQLKNMPALASALSAGIVALFLAELPYKLGLLVAIILGVGVGRALEIWSLHHRRSKEHSQ